MRNVLSNTLLLIASCIAGFLILEFVSRIIMPISPGSQTLNLDGKPASLDWTRTRLPRDAVFREVAPEYDAVITTTPRGHRIPGPEADPELIFIGDSFTFGTGLSDEQTFAWIFCNESKLQCANLGRGGTGTLRQIDILEEHLTTEGWKPKKVWLFIFAMTSSLMAGNDIADTLAELHSTGKANAATQNRAAADSSPFAQLLSYRKQLLENSNLVRIVHFQLGNYLRATLSPDSDDEQLQRGLEAVRQQLERFQSLSRTFGFEPRIFIIHPVQDIVRGTYLQTAAAIESIANGIRVVDTAPSFADAPTTYHYPYDGHLNERGAARMAEFILQDYEQSVTAVP